MCLNHPESIRSTLGEKLPPTKQIPGAKKVGDGCPAEQELLFCRVSARWVLAALIGCRCKLEASLSI